MAGDPRDNDQGGADPSELGLQQRTRQRQEADNADELPRRTAVLHLRPAPTAAEAARVRHRVTWVEDVEDRPGQRVSKSCCVFHKRKLFGESSSDSSSSDSEEGDRDAHGGVSNHSADEGGTCTENCDHSHKRRKRPPCTQEHCYCGTRFH